MVYAVIEIFLKAYSVVQGRMTERKNKRSLDVRVYSEIVPVNEAQRIVLIEISNRSTEQVNVTALKRTIGQGFFRRRHQVKASVTEFCRVMAEDAIDTDNPEFDLSEFDDPFKPVRIDPEREATYQCVCPTSPVTFFVSCAGYSGSTFASIRHCVP